MAKTLNHANHVFTSIFALEMVVKIFGLGIKNYVKDGFNDFDAIIVLVGLLEFADISSRGVLVLRCFRLLRIFKITRAWKSLRKILETLVASFSAIANLALLMFLLIFIYALIGIQFFSGEVPLIDG